MTERKTPPPAGPGHAGPEDLSPRAWKRVLLAAWKDAGEDNLALVSAGVAFYAFLAFVPLLSALVLSYGLIAEPASVVAHMAALTRLMPHDAAEIVGGQLRSMTETPASQTGFALLVAVGIALYGASKGATSVMTALNIVFEVGESRGFVARTLMALAMTAGAVVVLFLAILAISALNLVESLLPDWGGVLRFLVKAALFIAAGAGVILLLAVVYRYGPNRPKAPWRWITPGSLLAALVWLAATAGFGFYVANFGNYNATYGSLGAVIVFLTWLYLTAYIALFGAELNAVLELEAREVRPQPPKPAARAENGDSHSFFAVAARLGLFSVLLALLGRPRRAETRR